MNFDTIFWRYQEKPLPLQPLMNASSVALKAMTDREQSLSVIVIFIDFVTLLLLRLALTYSNYPINN